MVVPRRFDFLIGDGREAVARLADDTKLGIRYEVDVSSLPGELDQAFTVVLGTWEIESADEAGIETLVWARVATALAGGVWPSGHRHAV